MDVRHSARWEFAAIVSLVSLFLLAWPAAADLLLWKRVQIADGQAWRWISGHFVHLSTRHCLSNLLGLFVICDYVWDELGLAEAFVLSVWTAAGTSLMLWWLAPAIQWYAGLSGLLHGLWAGCALAWWFRTGDNMAGGALLLLVWAVLCARARRFGIFG